MRRARDDVILSGILRTQASRAAGPARHRNCACRPCTPRASQLSSRSAMPREIAEYAFEIWQRGRLAFAGSVRVNHPRRDTTVKMDNARPRRRNLPVAGRGRGPRHSRADVRSPYLPGTDAPLRRSFDLPRGTTQRCRARRLQCAGETLARPRPTRHTGGPGCTPAGRLQSCHAK